MFKQSEVFNCNSTVLPFTADQLNAIVKSTVSCGFVFCNYAELITTINKINRASTYDVTLNTDEIIKNNTDPTKNYNVVIQVEGDRKNNIYDAHIQADETGSFCSFDTYSGEFKEELFALKRKLAKKYLCTYEAINTWAIETGVSIAEDALMNMCNNFDIFEKYIMNTSDIESFVEALPSDIAKNYIDALNLNCTKILKKYKNEVLSHLKNITKLEATITLHKPIIVKIFALSGIASMAKRDWPTLPIVSLDRRAFDSLNWFV